MPKLQLIFATVVTACFIATSISCLSANESGAEKQPNIVILYSDDAGYADFGFQAGVRNDMKALTPNIDRIAKSGAVFTNAYMSGCVCSPSRAGMMTGRYQSRFGHDNNIPPGFMKGGLPKSETLMPKRLKKLGYRTGLIGKWHLGYPDGFQPNDRGFDWFYGCLQGSRSYFPMKKTTPHRVFLENRKPTPEGGYTTDRIGDGACRFIKENRDEPFFLFVSFTAPHGPLQPKQKDLDALEAIQDVKRRKYAGLVKALDDNVGKIMACLKEHDLTNNTLVIFTNDNGGQTKTGANNFPLRGSKGNLYEGGVRVPMAAQWPKVIKPGTQIDSPVISLDFLPTFVELGGGKVDPEWKLDGRSLKNLLAGKENTSQWSRTFYWRQHGSQGNLACRKDDWKLVFNRANQSEPELYDLSKDPSEQKDVAGEHPKLVGALRKELAVWEKPMKEPLWGQTRRPKSQSKK